MVKTLLSSLREYRRGSLFTVLLSILEAGFEILIPLCMARVIDEGIDLGDRSAVWRYGLLLLLLACFQLATGILGAHTAARVSAGFCRNLRQDMFDHVQTFAFSNIDRFSTASIVTRLTTDVTNIQNAYQMLLRMAVRGPVMLVVSMAVSFRIHRGIAWMFLAVIPVMALLLGLIVRAVNPVFERVFHTYDALNNVVQENVRGVRVVKSFCRETHEIDKFRTISGRIYQDFAKGERLLAFNAPIMQFFMYACMLFISWFGARAIVASGNNAALGLTTGDLTALFSYAMQILASLMMLSMVFAMITISVASARRIAELLDERAAITSPAEPVMEVADGSVCFSHVDFAYAAGTGEKVLRDIDLCVRSGETIGIVGGTGSSKSSLVQLIPRLYDVTAGSLTLGGVDVRRYDLGVLRDAVAMVLQKNELFSGTIRENLRWGNAHASDEALAQACRLACADEFIRSLPDGYDTHVEQGGANFSGGQKQRLCIARALLKNPKVLILDDSTSAVDTATDAAIRASLAEYLPETTKFIIAQRVASVQHADRIVVMDGGRIVAVGRHEELLQTCAIYREVYESQQKGGSEDAENEA